MFQDNMNRALNHVKGTMGCLLIGFDGIPIASVYSTKEPEIEAQLLAMSIETANMLRKIHHMASEGEVAFVHELSLASEKITTLARVIQREYLLVLAIEPKADLEAGMNILRLITPKIEREIMN